MLIDMQIRENSKGKQSLDDLMRYMYEKYYKELDRGYTDEEFQTAVEKFAGNMDDFFEKYVWGTEEIPYNEYFDAVGIRLVESDPNKEKPYLGASFQEITGGLVVTRVVRGTAAYEYGVNVNDLLLSVNGEEVTESEDVIKGRNPGDKLSLRLVRNGQVRTIELVLGGNENASFKFEPVSDRSKQQQANYEDWMSL